MSYMAVGLQSGAVVWGPAFIPLTVCYWHSYTSPDEATQEPFLFCSAGSFVCLQNSLNFCETWTLKYHTIKSCVPGNRLQNRYRYC